MRKLLSFLKRLVPPRWKRTFKLSIGFHDMQSRLENMKRAGFICTGAVDVGAYVGEWAETAHACFLCPVIAVEPQPDKQETLNQLATRLPIAIEPVALSTEVGSMNFRLEESNSRLALSSDRDHPPDAIVRVDRLDNLLDRHPNQAPNLLKVDVQGSELQVLTGAGTKLRQFEVVILEVSVIRIGEASVFSEVIDFMRSNGFRLYDFLPMYYRPLDGALWQGDAFFVSDDSKLVESLEWQ